MAINHVTSEFSYSDPVVNPNAIHFAVSQSGETADTIAAIKRFNRGGEVHGIVNVVGSKLLDYADRVYIHGEPDVSSLYKGIH